MIEKLPIAFAAGLLSVVTPCVLPLVPGYLSAISAVEVDRLGERGVGRRIAGARLPFSDGFTIVFVLFGDGESGVGSAVVKTAARYSDWFCLVVIEIRSVRILGAT